MAQWPFNLSAVELRKAAEEILNRTLDRSVRLAVTGLSGSGKTVFITSLVHQLLHGLHSSRLPFLNVINSGRFKGAKIVAQPDVNVPAFRYDEFLGELTKADPTWPEGTNGISEMRVAIRFRPGGLRRYLAEMHTLYLDIIDYPGEWLLDLPLLDLSFEQWSDQVLKRCELEPRRSLSREWVGFTRTLDPLLAAREDEIRRASDLYTASLQRCKSAGLSLLQPGRFVMPGELKGAPVLTFCPLARTASLQIPKNSFYAVMSERYEAYKDVVVRSFYKEHFSRFDRQVVLVDVLKSLNTGYGNFADMQDSIGAILKSFNYGKSGFITRLFRPKIDKLLFAATKADHIAPNQHNNLKSLFEKVIAECENNAVFEGVTTDTITLSSIKATQSVIREYEGRKLSCVRGVPEGEHEKVDVFPGEVPEEIPPPSSWVEGRFNFLEFRPPVIADPKGEGLPHIRLDKALEFLIGDKLP